MRSEFTVYRTGLERFYLVGAGAFERHDWDTLGKLLPSDGRSAAPEDHDADGRPRPRRPALARASAEAHRHRSVECSLPLAVGTVHQCGYRAGACAEGQFRGRARLRAASSDRNAEHDLRSGHEGGEGFRDQALRHQGHGFAAGSRNPTGSFRASCRSNMQRSNRASTGSCI